MLSASLDDSRLFYNFWETISNRGFKRLAFRVIKKFKDVSSYDLLRKRFDSDLLYTILTSSSKGRDLVRLCLEYNSERSTPINLESIPSEKPLPKGSRDILFLRDIPRFIETNNLSLGLAWLRSILDQFKPSGALDIGTFNVCGLPEPIGSVGVKRERFHKIGRKLRDLKIVGLQEMWHENCVSLIDSAGFPYSVWDAKERSRLSHKFIGRSGLALLSAYPIEQYHFLYFSESAGLERFVRKGALFARIKTPLGLIDIWNTHLVSEPERLNRLLVTRSEADSVRLRQLEELEHWISIRSKRGIPKIILGDFNIDESHESYSKIKQFGGEDLYRLRLDKPGFTFDPSTNPFANSPNNTPERLDYIWSNLDLEKFLVGAKRFIMSEPLSDHYGVKTSLEAL